MRLARLDPERAVTLLRDALVLSPQGKASVLSSLRAIAIDDEPLVLRQAELLLARADPDAR